LQGVHLILHEGDERGDNDGEAGPDEGGELEAEGFAAAGGQDGHNIPAGEGIADDLLLERPEGTETEDLFQGREELFAMKRHRGRLAGERAADK
jgi:hypothetical protein